jgi:hypothetical protein
MLTPASRVRNSRPSKVRTRIKDAGASGPSERLPFRDFTAEEFLGRTLTIGAGGGFFREAVSLAARWLMRAFMLAGRRRRFESEANSIAGTRRGRFRPVEAATDGVRPWILRFSILDASYLKRS